MAVFKFIHFNLNYFTKDSPSNFPKSEPGQLSYKKFMPLLGKSRRILFEK